MIWAFFAQFWISVSFFHFWYLKDEKFDHDLLLYLLNYASYDDNIFRITYTYFKNVNIINQAKKQKSYHFNNSKDNWKQQINELKYVINEMHSLCYILFLPIIFAEKIITCITMSLMLKNEININKSVSRCRRHHKKREIFCTGISLYIFKIHVLTGT